MSRRQDYLGKQKTSARALPPVWLVTAHFPGSSVRSQCLLRWGAASGVVGLVSAPIALCKGGRGEVCAPLDQGGVFGPPHLGGVGVRLARSVPRVPPSCPSCPLPPSSWGPSSCTAGGVVLRFSVSSAPPPGGVGVVGVGGVSGDEEPGSARRGAGAGSGVGCE